jgi:hypothetical protein
VSDYQSIPYAIVEIRRCPDSAARCPLRSGTPAAIGDTDRGLRCLDVTGSAAAADHLRAYLFQSGDIETLRRIAAQEDLTSLLLSEHQVVEQVAALVERRTVCLLGSVIARAATFGVTPAPPPAGARPSATGLTPSRHHPRSEPPAAPAAAAGDTLDVDDAQQVAVLEEAARDGVPFCEECEKAHQRPHDH